MLSWNGLNEFIQKRKISTKKGDSMSIIDNLYDDVFIKNLREYGHNLNELGNTLSNVTEPFEVTASLYSDELSEGFISIDGPSTRYQVLYLALNHDNEFYLTTSPKMEISEYADNWITDEAVDFMPEIIFGDYYYPRTIENIKIIKDGKVYVFDKNQSEEDIKAAQQYVINWLKNLD